MIPIRIQDSPRSGFTLVELLLVTAIVLLLTALLHPVVSRGLERARESACLANMQQWGRALSLYLIHGPREPVTDTMRAQFGRRRQGELPHQHIVGFHQEPDLAEHNPYAWFNALPPYLDQKSLYQRLQDGEPMPRPRDASIWTCPSVPPGEAQDFAPDQPFLSFAYNMYIDHNVKYPRSNTSTQTRHGVMRAAGLIGPDEWSPYPFLLRIQNISDPSRFVVFTEDRAGNSAATHARFAAYRHGGSREHLHITFADGAARAYPKHQVHFTYSGPQSRVWNRGGLVWFEGGINTD